MLQKRLHVLNDRMKKYLIYFPLYKSEVIDSFAVAVAQMILNGLVLTNTVKARTEEERL